MEPLCTLVIMSISTKVEHARSVGFKHGKTLAPESYQEFCNDHIIRNQTVMSHKLGSVKMISLAIMRSLPNI